MSSAPVSGPAKRLAARFVNGTLDSGFSSTGDFILKGTPTVDPATLAVTVSETSVQIPIAYRRFTQQEIAMSGGAIRQEDFRVTLLLANYDASVVYTGNSVLLQGNDEAPYGIIGVTPRPSVGIVVLHCRR